MAAEETQICKELIANATDSKLKFVKELAEAPNFTSVPTNYAYFTDPIESAVYSDSHESIPVVDLSLLQFGTPDQQSKIIHDLGKACQDWGFFMVVNHRMSESLMKAMMDKCKEFFNLTREEKQEYEGKNVLDPIRCGTSFNTSVENVSFWRDFVKFMVHPEFHCPTKPHGFSEIASEYVEQIRHIARVLLRGISTSLGLDALEIERSMDLKMGHEKLVANYYPPCPQPNIAIGLPPHSDHGLLTILAENQVGGLEIQHKGRWISVNALPNSFLVNTGDQIEVLSNGKYQSVVHRATVNNKATRISIAAFTGPSLDVVVGPASKLINGVGCTPAKYKPMTYKEYMEHQQSNRLDGKSCLDVVRI